MRSGHGRFMALAIRVLRVNGCSKQEGHLPGMGARGGSPRAFVVPACGGIGPGALEFYSAQGPNESGSHRATHITMRADRDPAQSGGNFIIMPGSYILFASRCPLAGECETAIRGTLQVSLFRPGQGAYGKYEIGFKDGSVERATFDAAYHNPDKELFWT